MDKQMVDICTIHAMYTIHLVVLHKFQLRSEIVKYKWITIAKREAKLLKNLYATTVRFSTQGTE